VSIALMAIPAIQAFEEENQDTIINVIIDEPILDLDLDNRLVRATVEVINYNPSGDGYYYMQIIQPGGKIITEKEIMMRERGNQIWGAQIAGMLIDEQIMKNGKPVLGDYLIKIITETKSATGSGTFSIIKSSETIPPIKVDEPAPTTQEESEPIIPQVPDIATEIENKSENSTSGNEINSNGKSEPKIPDWVKNMALWYGEGTVSEDEFISAIQFLISEGIVKI
jgi:hypothetical protein